MDVAAISGLAARRPMFPCKTCSLSSPRVTSPRLRGEVAAEGQGPSDFYLNARRWRRALAKRGRVRGALDKSNAMKQPLTPTLSVEVGCFRLRPLAKAPKSGKPDFRVQAGRGSPAWS